MFNDLDPRERKALIIFFAILALIITYLGTHDLSFQEKTNIFEQQDSFQQIDPEPRSYESYL